MYRCCYDLACEVLNNLPILNQKHDVVERLRQKNLVAFSPVPKFGCHNCKIIEKKENGLFLLNDHTFASLMELPPLFLMEGLIQKERQRKDINNTMILFQVPDWDDNDDEFNLENIFKQTAEDVFEEFLEEMNNRLSNNSYWTLTLHPTGFVLKSKNDSECQFLFTTRILQSRLYNKGLVQCKF